MSAPTASDDVPTAASSTSASKPRTALDFNLPKGDNFFSNARGQRLHVRIFLPEAGVEMKALLFWYPGYAAHVNGPTLRSFAEGMAADGFAVIGVDQHGHGYSDGDTVLISDYKDLIADNLAVFDIVTKATPDGEQSKLGLDVEVRDKMATLPFFLGGQSLGGALCLLMALHIRSDATRSAAASKFAGAMVNCPAIRANPPPKPVLLVLRHVVAPIFPARQIPKFMEKVSVPELVWLSKEHMEMGALDKIGQPGGLGWPGSMRFGTGVQLLDMLAELELRLSEIDFPFLVLHDPEDGVVRFEGTEMLLKEATTPPDVARGKELKEMRGLKHDLVSNASKEMLAAYLDWAGARLESSSPQT